MSEATNTVLSDTTLIPWARLRKSKNNVRKTKPSLHDDAALEANIGQTGQILENLIVAEIPDQPGFFEVLAGGRRLNAVQANVKSGALPDTFEVPCRIQTSGSHISTSLSENLHVQMHPADEFVAFKNMLQTGLTVGDVAKRFGLSVKHVNLRLELARVHPTILSAYRSADIELETVMAFTLAPSKAAQKAAFEELGSSVNAYQVRRYFVSDGVRSDDRLATFVGLEVYIEAGGVVTEDLFSDFDYWHDGALVESLASTLLAEEAARREVDEGWQDVVFSTDAYVAMTGWIRADSADKSDSVALLKIDHDGKAQLDGPFQRIETKPVAAKTSDSNAMSAALLTDIGGYREQIVKLALLGDDALANDALLYALCVGVFGETGAPAGLNISALRGHPSKDIFASTVAATRLRAVEERLRLAWLALDSDAQRFAALRRLNATQKQRLQTFCVSASFSTGAATDSTSGLDDAVVDALGIDFAAFWRPTGDSYFSRLRKTALISLGTELFGSNWAAEHGQKSKKLLVGWFSEFFQRKSKKDEDEAHKTVRAQWLPEGFVSKKNG